MIEMWDEPRLPGRFRCAETSAILQIEAPAVPNEIEFLGRGWRAKREFHVTLLGSEAMEKIRAAAADEVVRIVRRLARSPRMSVQPGTAFWILEEPPQATIAVECAVHGAAWFYQRIDETFRVAIEPPPFHVTLFTAGGGKGIGIHSREAMEELGRRLTSEEEEGLEAAMRSRGAPPRGPSLVV